MLPSEDSADDPQTTIRMIQKNVWPFRLLMMAPNFNAPYTPLLNSSQVAQCPQSWLPIGTTEDLKILIISQRFCYNYSWATWASGSLNAPWRFLMCSQGEQPQIKQSFHLKVNCYSPDIFLISQHHWPIRFYI